MSESGDMTPEQVRRAAQFSDGYKAGQSEARGGYPAPSVPYRPVNANGHYHPCPCVACTFTALPLDVVADGR